MDINDLNSKYEKKHLQNIARTNERIREVFSDAIHTLTLSAGRIRFNGEVFDLSKYPALKAQIEEVIQEMGGTIYTALVNSIEASWGLANEKNDILVDRRLAGKKPTEAGRSILYDPNKGALEAFIKRKDKGLDLSKRVWNSLEPFKTELEKGLGLGIAEGKPAKAMATELKQFLNEPDKLFRRVRDAKGKLRLSKAAKAYHPGQGVYRSSFKNAARLTRTETNMAYRNADFERWQGLDFVTGIEVKLSNRHPEFDICDHVKGKYPKDFKFTGWHPQCLCHAVPLFATDEEYEKMEDAILAGEDTPKVKGIEDVPQGFKDYVKDNKERIAGWKNQPYWAKDNPEYFAGKQPAKVVELPKAEKPTFAPAKTTAEAVERLRALGIKEVDLKGLKPNMANSVLEAAEREASFGRFNLDRLVTYRSSGTTSAALYSPSNNSVSINLAHVGKHEKEVLKSYAEQLDYYKDLKKKYQEEYLGNPKYKQSTVSSRINAFNVRMWDIEQKIRDGEVARYHTVSSMADTAEEALKRTVTHELGHYRHFKTVGEDKYFAFWKKNAVSEYGRTNNKEFFAEWFTHYRIFGEKGVPESLLKLFKEIDNAK